MSCDIHFKKVALLLDFDGAGGSTTFTDMSNNAIVITPHSGAVVDASAPKFGMGCFDSSSGEFLSFPASIAGPLDLSGGTYTIECWIKTTYAGPGTNYDWVLCLGHEPTSGSPSGVQLGIYENAGNPLFAVCVVNSAGSNQFSAPGAPAINDGNWHAVCFESYSEGGNPVVSLYVDGIRYVHANMSPLAPVAYTQGLIGQDTSGRVFPGQIDELRITNGYVRYRDATYAVATSAFGIACIGEQPVIPVMEDQTFPGQWASPMGAGAGYPNYVYTYDPPTYQDADCNVAVLFTISFASNSPPEAITAANVTATYGGQSCQAFVQNINPTNGSYTYQRCTLLLLCLLPVGSSFSNNELHIAYSGITVAPTIYVTLGATALLVDPSYTLASPESLTDTATLSPFNFTIPSYTAPINHLMVSVFDCGVSSPGFPAVISSPTFQVDSDVGTGVPIGVANRQLLSGSESNAVSWNYTPTPITVGSGQFFWGNTFSLPPAPFGVAVPSVIGDTPTDANTEITGAGFAVGSVTSAPSNAQPAGFVFFQNPAGGFLADPGSSVDYIISTGPAAAFVPNIVGETADQANNDIVNAGFQVGAVTTANSDTVAAGLVISQAPAGGTQAALGTFVSYVLSLGPVPPPPPTTGAKFDFEATVISQYANSPTLLQLCSNMNDYVDQSTNFATFFDFVWNVNTAQGFGLDIWGKIVNISRLLTIPNSSRNFGFKDNVTPPDYDPFNVSPFNSKGGGATQTYLLNDAAYRTLILTKALSNISATTAPAINQLLRNLFPGRGRCYVLDLGGMAMQFTFEFQLTVTEFAILAQSKALPRPAGVAVNIVTLSGGPILGFEEAGGSAESFGFGHFY